MMPTHNRYVVAYTDLMGLAISEYYGTDLRDCLTQHVAAHHHEAVLSDMMAQLITQTNVHDVMWWYYGADSRVSVAIKLIK